MASTDDLSLAPGACCFYGVRPSWARLWQQALAEGRDWYYVDNAFFDVDREQRFRVAKNCVQMSTFPARDYPPFRGTIAPWRQDGEHIVVCAQSDEFMRTVIGYQEHWADTVCRTLRRYTTRPIVRTSKGSKASLARAMHAPVPVPSMSTDTPPPLRPTVHAHPVATAIRSSIDQ